MKNWYLKESQVITQATQEMTKGRKDFVSLPCQPRTLRANSTTANCIPRQTPVEGKGGHGSPLSPHCKAHTPSQSTLRQRKTWMRQIFDWDLGICSPQKLYFPPFPIPSAHTQFSLSPQTLHWNAVTNFSVPGQPGCCSTSFPLCFISSYGSNMFLT